MTQSNPTTKKNTTRIEQPGDDGPCDRCADREEDCRECQETNTMTAHDWTRAAYGDGAGHGPAGSRDSLGDSEEAL